MMMIIIMIIIIEDDGAKEATEANYIIIQTAHTAFMEKL